MYLPLYTTGETVEPHMPFLFHGKMMRNRGWKNPVPGNHFLVAILNYLS
jgi:hypothetical protein